MDITKNNWINVLKFINKIVNYSKLDSFIKRICFDKEFKNKTKKYIFTNQNEEIVVSSKLINFINEVDSYIQDWREE